MATSINGSPFQPEMVTVRPDVCPRLATSRETLDMQDCRRRKCMSVAARRLIIGLRALYDSSFMEGRCMKADVPDLKGCETGHRPYP